MTVRLAPETDAAFGRWQVKLASDADVADAWHRNRAGNPNDTAGVERGLRRRFGMGALALFSFETRREAEAFRAGIEVGAAAAGAVVLATYYETDWRYRT